MAYASPNNSINPIIPAIPKRRGFTPLTPALGQPQPLSSDPSQQDNKPQSPPPVVAGAESYIAEDYNRGQSKNNDTVSPAAGFLPRRLDDLRIIEPNSYSRPSAIKGKTAQQAYNEWGARIQKKVDMLAGYLISYLDQLRFAAYTQRESRNFQNRYLRNETRARVTTNTRLRPDGTVDTSAEDGHAELGITQGWSFQAIKNASAFLYRNMMEASPDPFILRCQSDNQRSNEVKEKVVGDVLRDLIECGQMRKQIRNLSRIIPRQGTSYLRYELGRQVEYRRNQWGAFKEYTTELCPTFTIYDPQNILVTNYSLPEASDQDGVFFIWPNATLTYLSRDEAVFEWADERGERVLRVSGKYRGLQRIREQLRYQGAIYGGVGSTPGTVNPAWWYYNASAVSNEPIFTQIDYEGPLPIAFCVQNNLIDYELAQYLGIDVGFDPDPNNDDQMREWGIRLQRITHYKFSYLADMRGGMIPFGQQTNTGRYMVQFEPTQHRCPRNSLYVFRYQQDGLEFLGMSITDIGRKLEDAGDMLRNTELWKKYFNGHPSALVDLRVLVNRTNQQMAKLLHTPRAVIEAMPGADLEKAVQFLKYELDDTVEVTIAHLKNEFEMSTGVNATAKGAPNPSTGTLGEVQIDEAKSTLELGDVLLGCGLELARLFTNMLDDKIFHEGPENFYDYATRVSGVSPTDLRKAFPDVSKVIQEVHILHPLAVQGDKTVLATIIMRLFQLVGPSGFGNDIPGFTRAILELIQYPNSEKLTQQQKSLSPDDEHKMMSEGDWVDPEPIDNQQEHLMKHMQMLMAISKHMPLPYSPEEIENLKVLLPRHIEDTLSMLATQVNTSFLQQMGSSQVGPPGPTDAAGQPAQQDQEMNGQPGVLNGTGAGGGGLQNNSGQPTRMEQDTNPADSQGLTGAIIQQSRGVPGSNLTAGPA